MLSFPCLPSSGPSTTPAFFLTKKLRDFHYQKLSCCIVGNASIRALMLQPQIRSESSSVPTANSSSMAPDFKQVPMENNSTKANNWKSKGSPQLKRWSRARNIRSGRRLDRPVQDKAEPSSSPSSSTYTTIPSIPNRIDEYEGSDDEDDKDLPSGKTIYMVSDGTGWTAEHSVHAALGQFETCLVDRGCGVNTHLFSGVSIQFHSFFLWYVVYAFSCKFSNKFMGILGIPAVVYVNVITWSHDGKCWKLLKVY
jgi:hypothetical protein